MVPALTVQPRCNQDKRGSQGFELGRRFCLVNGLDGLDASYHEWYDDEKVHGFEAMAQIVESDESLKTFFGLGGDLLRSSCLVSIIAQGLKDGKNEVVVVYAVKARSQ